MLEGHEFIAATGDVIRLPMNLPHGMFNKTDQIVKCFFWVAPTRKLYDLYWAIHGMKEQNPPDVVALSAKHEVMFPAAAGVKSIFPRREFFRVRVLPSNDESRVGKGGKEAPCHSLHLLRASSAWASLALEPTLNKALPKKTEEAGESAERRIVFINDRVKRGVRAV